VNPEIKRLRQRLGTRIKTPRIQETPKNNGQHALNSR
jgi:hypothetical protein